jgi:hypothetical protein
MEFFKYWVRRFYVPQQKNSSPSIASRMSENPKFRPIQMISPSPSVQRFERQREPIPAKIMKKAAM